MWAIFSFDFYNGAMSTAQCYRLRDAFLYARFAAHESHRIARRRPISGRMASISTSLRRAMIG